MAIKGRKCEDCGASIDNRPWNAKRCEDCTAKARERSKKEFFANRYEWKANYYADRDPELSSHYRQLAAELRGNSQLPIVNEQLAGEEAAPIVAEAEAPVNSQLPSQSSIGDELLAIDNKQSSIGKEAPGNSQSSKQLPISKEPEKPVKKGRKRLGFQCK